MTLRAGFWDAFKDAQMEHKKSNTAHIAESWSCKDCGWPIVHCCCNDEMGKGSLYGSSDYWGYCSNKACKNHEGEDWGQYPPDFCETEEEKPMITDRIPDTALVRFDFNPRTGHLFEDEYGGLVLYKAVKPAIRAEVGQERKRIIELARKHLCPYFSYNAAWDKFHNAVEGGE